MTKFTAAEGIKSCLIGICGIVLLIFAIFVIAYNLPFVLNHLGFFGH